MKCYLTGVLVLLAVILSVSDARSAKKKTIPAVNLNLLREFEREILLNKVHKVQPDNDEGSGDEKRSDVQRLVSDDSSGSGSGSGSASGSGGIELPPEIIRPFKRPINKKPGLKPSGKKPIKKLLAGIKKKAKKNIRA